MQTHKRIALIVLILLLASNLLVGVWYKVNLRYGWFDQLYHFLGGFFVAMFLIPQLQDMFPRPFRPLRLLFLLLASTLFVGVLWEFLEFGSTKMFAGGIPRLLGARSLIGSLEDTISDLGMDIMGAVVYGAVFMMRQKNGFS